MDAYTTPQQFENILSNDINSFWLARHYELGNLAPSMVEAVDALLALADENE